ncbi:MAG: TonB-dependent receptor, partial [Sphingobacterium sp.]
MKLIFLIILFPLTVVGQEITLIGLIQSEQHQPIHAATISLLDYESNHLVGTALSNEHGRFSATINAQDSLVVEITHLGFEKYSSVFVLNSADSLIINLQAKIGSLEEVSVIAKPPIITRKVDRLIFQVEESLISSLNSWEILKKTPLVSAQGPTLSVRGNPNIKVLINDKPIMLTGEDLKVLLEGNNGSDIKRIEVITNPPAKYDASNAAIINIIMKNNELFGYKGVLTGRYTQSNYAKELIGISNFYRSDKWNFKLNYNFISGTYARYGTDYIFYPEDQTQWKTTLNRIDHAKRQSSYS